MTFTAVGLALLTSLLWGGTPVAVSYATDSLPPIAIACIRFALAAVVMLVWCRLEGTSIRPLEGEFKWMLGASVILFVQIILFNVGTDWSNSSHSTLIINGFVFFVVLIEHFFTRTHRLTARKLVGLILAFAGLFLIFTISRDSQVAPAGGHDTATLKGDFVLLASTLVLSVKIIFTKQAVMRVAPSRFILWHDVGGVLLFATASLLTENVRLEGFTTPAVLALLYQGLVVAGLCFPIQALLLRRHSATQISVFAFTTPIFGITLAVSFRGDPLSSWLIVSGALVTFGILLVNMRSRQ